MASSFQTEVDRIKADIAALPKEAQALILGERTWATAHPNLAAVAFFAAGVVIALIGVAIGR